MRKCVAYVVPSTEYDVVCTYCTYVSPSFFVVSYLCTQIRFFLFEYIKAVGDVFTTSAMQLIEVIRYMRFPTPPVPSTRRPSVFYDEKRKADDASGRDRARVGDAIDFELRAAGFSNRFCFIRSSTYGSFHWLE